MVSRKISVVNLSDEIGSWHLGGIGVERQDVVAFFKLACVDTLEEKVLVKFLIMIFLNHAS